VLDGDAEPGGSGEHFGDVDLVGLATEHLASGGVTENLHERVFAGAQDASGDFFGRLIEAAVHTGNDDIKLGERGVFEIECAVEQDIDLDTGKDSERNTGRLVAGFFGFFAGLVTRPLGAFFCGELFGQLVRFFADARGVCDGSLVVHAVSHGEMLGVVSDGDVLKAAFYGGLSHFADGVGAIGLSGVHVQVAAKVAANDELGQCTLCSSIDFAAVLAAALLAAIRATGIKLREHTEFQLTTAAPNTTVIYTTGAWVPEELRRTLLVRPRKGQMLRVQLPPSLGNLREVHRSDQIYIVPRTVGTQAGTALIGATIEDAGFDTSTHTRDLIHLRDLAAMLLPALASEKDAPQLEAWAGLRPYTPDRLPILGPVEPGSHRFLATGHYRNGILLAPATAILLADLITGKTPALDLMPFSPARFSQS